jgi:hypothetical protein
MHHGDLATRRRLVGAGLSLGLGWVVSPFQVQAKAVSIEGIPFDDALQLHGVQLVLNGVGVRAVAWIKGYAAGLYLTRRSTQVDGVLSAPGPKRLRLHMLMDVPALEFSKAFDKGVRRNVTPDQLPQLQSRIERFEGSIAALKTVHKGDVVDLDFDPSKGLVFQLNGTLQGEPVAGADFYAAVLKSFIGEQPYDKTLRAGLLGVLP